MCAEADLAVVGGGIVGLAIARTFARRSSGRVVVFEKERDVALHQSGRNSGVLHSGLYYRPGSRKARLAVRGRALVEEALDAAGLSWIRTGKVVVAVDQSEVPRLDELERRGRANGVPLRRVDADGLRQLEPHARGVAALHVETTGVTDYAALARAWARELEETGHELAMGTHVLAVEPDGDAALVRTATGEHRARRAIVAAGLFADRVARASGVPNPQTLLPFRGEYWELAADVRHLCRGLIYPVPDPTFPFLGVHLSRTVDGRVLGGPSAVPAFAREGYSKREARLSGVLEAARSKGFRRLAAGHWRTGAAELWRSFSKASFARALARLVPDVEARHLIPAPAGVRAQAVLDDGSLADDFLIERHGPVLHVLNAPSPAATASLAIAEEVLAM